MVHPSTSEYRNETESLHVKQIANWQRKAVMAPADRELKEKGRTVTGVTGQENLSPSGLVVCLSPPPSLLPPPRPAVPVLTATSHTLHLPSGSGREQKGQPADSPLAGTTLVGVCWPMGILTHLMWHAALWASSVHARQEGEVETAKHAKGITMICQILPN